MPSERDYEELQDDRNQTWLLQRVCRALEALVAQASAMPGLTVQASLADVVRAEALVVSGPPRRLHVRFRIPPLQQGILPSYFHWALVAALADVDPDTEAAFPGAQVARAVSIVCDLVQRLQARLRSTEVRPGVGRLTSLWQGGDQQ